MFLFSILTLIWSATALADCPRPLCYTGSINTGYPLVEFAKEEKCVLMFKSFVAGDVTSPVSFSVECKEVCTDFTQVYSGAGFTFKVAGSIGNFELKEKENDISIE